MSVLISSIKTSFSLKPALPHANQNSFLAKYAFFILLLIGLTAELFFPYLIWKKVLPSAVRWLGDISFFIIIVISMARMFAFNKIPMAAFMVVAITIIWSVVAYFEGQAPLTTVWGWWVLFKYPLTGIFTYLQSTWPERMSEYFVKVCMAALTMELLVQTGQYFNGQIPGDNLAGTFGRKGVSGLLMFVLVVISIALGQWLATGDWKKLVWALLLGSIASGFGEMKIFPVAVVALAAVALAIHTFRGRDLHRLGAFIVLFVITVPAFITFYNRVVSDARGTRRFEEYFEEDTRDTYLNKHGNKALERGRYYLGRGFALQYGWEVIHRDAATFLFGYGLGTRGESVSFGLVGAALEQGDFGLTSGTSLLVLMQETGVVGLSVFAIFLGWAIVTMYRDARDDPDSHTTVIRYGLMVYSIMWPVWLWYHQTWNQSVSMIMYWAALGYVLNVGLKQRKEAEMDIQL